MNNTRLPVRFGLGAIAAALLGALPLASPAADDAGKAIIGVALPQVHIGQGAEAGEPLRQAVMDRLRSPGVELVALAGGTAAEIEADAREKGCSEVLYTTVEQKQGIGGFLKKLAPVASLLPGLAGASGGGGSGLTGLVTQGAASMASNAAASAAQKQIMGAQQQMLPGQPGVPAQVPSLQAVAMAGIKRGDNIAFDYRLAPIGGGAPIKSASLRAKADSDGQDLLSPLVEQLAQAVNPAGTGSVPAAEAGRTEHASPWQGLFGSRNKAAATTVATRASPPAGGMPDCAQIASMPNAPISLEACQKMMAAQQAYDRAAADPSAARPGDEQLSCDQIKSEMRLQQFTAPDKATVATTTAAVTQEQALLGKHMAEANAVMAQEQAKVDAAAAVDRATAVATGGVVQTNTAGVVAEAAQARVREVGKRQAAERRPTEQKMIGGVADLGMDAAQQLSSNPRLARLFQLAQAHGCKGS